MCKTDHKCRSYGRLCVGPAAVLGLLKIIPNSDVGLSLDCENLSPRFFLSKSFGRSLALGLASLSVKSQVDLLSLTSSIRCLPEEGCCVHVIRF